MNYIYLDIETIPTQNPSVKKHIARTVAPPPTYKKQDSIDKWMIENKSQEVEKRWKKTSFDGGYGHVCVIGAAVNDQPVQLFYKHDWPSEKEILTEFYTFLHDSYTPHSQAPPIFVGHYIADFDLRFLFQRAVVLGVNPPHFLPQITRAWDNHVYDTMYQWAGYGGSIGLDNLCNILDIAGKGSEIDAAIDGSQVWNYVNDGKIDLVAQYCAGDVERVRQIHHRLTFN